MKKLCVGFIAVVLAFSFTSCSTNETDFETPQENLLKKAQLKRDASGAYSVDYIVADNTASDARKDLSSLTNEIHLSKVGYDTKDQYREDLILNEDTLRIGFFDNETGKQTKIQIEDENITFAKGNASKFLKEFGLSTNDDGSIQLDFEVNNNVLTEFVYNEVLVSYEVHLSMGESNNLKFSRTLEMPDSGVLKLNFMNHLLLSKGESESIVEKPKVIWTEE